jgi:hypothetical protein
MPNQTARARSLPGAIALPVIIERQNEDAAGMIGLRGRRIKLGNFRIRRKRISSVNGAVTCTLGRWGRRAR